MLALSAQFPYKIGKGQFTKIGKLYADNYEKASSYFTSYSQSKSHRVVKEDFPGG